jgi:hypothetical protein
MLIMRRNARNTIESTRVAGMTPRVVETVQDRGAHGADLTRGVAVGGDRGAVERHDLRALYGADRFAPFASGGFQRGDRHAVLFGGRLDEGAQLTKLRDEGSEGSGFESFRAHTTDRRDRRVLCSTNLCFG